MLGGWFAKRRERAQDTALRTAIGHAVQDWHLLEIEERPHAEWAGSVLATLSMSIDRSKVLDGFSDETKIDLIATVIAKEGPLTRAELCAALGAKHHPVAPQTAAWLARIYGPEWHNETEQGL